MDEVYEVERILNKREAIVDGKSTIIYLIKWKNYDTAESTWEPEENLDDECDKHISNYILTKNMRKMLKFQRKIKISQEEYYLGGKSELIGHMSELILLQKKLQGQKENLELEIHGFPRTLKKKHILKRFQKLPKMGKPMVALPLPDIVPTTEVLSEEFDFFIQNSPQQSSLLTPSPTPSPTRSPSRDILLEPSSTPKKASGPLVKTEIASPYRARKLFAQESSDDSIIDWRDMVIPLPTKKKLTKTNPALMKSKRKTSTSKAKKRKAEKDNSQRAKRRRRNDTQSFIFSK